MSLEDYLKQNIKPEVLQKAMEFINSSDYQATKIYVSSKEYQSAKMQLKLRDKDVHKTILSDIKKLQEDILIGWNHLFN